MIDNYNVSLVIVVDDDDKVMIADKVSLVTVVDDDDKS